MKHTSPKARIDKATALSSISVSQAINQLDAAGTGALVLCDEDGQFIALLTDGDIRRALLAKIDLGAKCLQVANTAPITLTAPISSSHALKVMNQHDINELPIIDSSGKFIVLLLRKDLVAEEKFKDDIKERIALSTIQQNASISQALKALERAGTGALLLIDEQSHFEAILTDGDIRRAILNKYPLDSSVNAIAAYDPVTLAENFTNSEALQLMNSHDINHLPVLDSQGFIVSFLLRKDLVDDNFSLTKAVIMAGGFGLRLRPLTDNIPKPMLPIGNRPLLELTISQLKRAGIHEIFLTTHYLPDKIKEYFGNGKKYDVTINYVHEEKPLGTAGSLKLIKSITSTLLVLNGDIITGVPFQSMYTFHQKHRADMTVGVKRYEISIPYGVIECEGAEVQKLAEKPVYSFFINAGTYLIEPYILEYINDFDHLDMTDLIELLISAKRKVVSFPIVEYWLDIGRHEDYIKAQEDLVNGKLLV